jgi:hypothetical protein
MIKRQFRTEEEFENFFFGEDAEKEYIYDNIVDSIEIAMFEDLDVADFAEIMIAGDTIDIKCEKHEFSMNLQNALKYYVDNEIFEKCKRVQDLINEHD